ncbi:MAG: glycosyltransferase [Burkholderiaceae bacterium]|nr:glycosyltransferase [Burkholderiaceae bacterium]
MQQVSAVIPRRQHARSRVGAWFAAIAIALAVGAANMGVWQYLNPPIEAPVATGPIHGLAYNAYGRWDSPIAERYPSEADIDADMALLATYTDRIRTYTSGEFPMIPELAQRHGLKLTAGVWLDHRFGNNQKEITAVIRAAQSGAVERVVAGNETILHNIFTVSELTDQLRALRRELRVPVSTAEPWHVWMRNPSLVDAVDYITVHLLPYWEGVPADGGAVDYAMQRLEQMRKRFPHKHIVIGEIGWPSQGDRFDGVSTSPAAQAQFLREFLARVQNDPSIDYFLMEAVDQPWKAANEGRVGGYWGMLHADRTEKFSFDGPLFADPSWHDKAVLACLLAFGPLVWFCLAFARMRIVSRVAFALIAQAVASFVVWLVALPLDYYLRPVDWIALLVLVPSLTIMAGILLSHAFEFAELFWKGNLRREFEPLPAADPHHQPFVSVHLACCNEPPEMVIATIESLRGLDYANYEVLVIDNNTRDEALWKPVEAFMAGLGGNFRFFHLENWPGFKAGALNFALSQTDPRAEVIGVVDADYVVEPDWLSGYVGYFSDPSVGVVQAPQAHREWGRQLFRRMMNWEYDGFFRIGMHHRNERDAIIQHGTMTLVRAESLERHGRWSEWCICEDSELGLRLMKEGMRTVYIDRVMGRGLTPDDFAAFRKQRKRWAQGAMQIMKAHWRDLVRPGRLRRGQRYHFVAGWLPWIGDALHLVFALAAMFYTIGIMAAPKYFSLPITLFMVPLAVFVVAKVVIGPLLYMRRVPCSIGEIFGAALSGMGLSHAIATGVFTGLAQKTGVFEITKKGSKVTPGGSFGAVREEAMLLLGLVTCAVGMALTRLPNHVESLLWMGVLGLLAAPYLAALLCQVLSLLPERTEKAPAKVRPLPSNVVPIGASPRRPMIPAGLSPLAPAAAHSTQAR